MSRLLLTLWLLVLPLTGMVFLSYRFDHWGIDTSEEAATGIRPGMTIQEVERIVGGPPGDYRSPEPVRFRKYSGNQWPYVLEWTTYNGRIEVRDGEWGIQGPPPSRATAHHDPNSSELQEWSTADGVVDSVRWSAVEPQRSNWKLAEAAFWRALFCFGFTWFLYAALLRHNRGSNPATPSSGPAS
ncbi:hypothetical protein [Gemmata sp.]|uniref:hypothetical protein n=1 Tax=Gemmata sp. TaxID=1914242 RepID=UPI003F70B503